MIMLKMMIGKAEMGVTVAEIAGGGVILIIFAVIGCMLLTIESAQTSLIVMASYINPNFSPTKSSEMHSNF